MKILVDMNLSPRWVDFLSSNGIEAVHWSSIGFPDAPDTGIMAYAQAHGFVVLTNDLDFGFILAISRSKKPSVIQVRTGALGPDRIGSRVFGALKILSADIEEGAMVTVDPRRSRYVMKADNEEPVNLNVLNVKSRMDLPYADIADSRVENNGGEAEGLANLISAIKYLPLF